MLAHLTKYTQQKLARAPIARLIAKRSYGTTLGGLPGLPLGKRPAPAPFKVGILDLGAWLAKLPKLVARINRAQNLFTLYEINAPVPAWLIKSPETILTWAKTVKKSTDWKVDDLGSNVIAGEFFASAEDIRAHMSLDYIIGMTPAMIAGVSEKGRPYANYFTSIDKRKVLVSTADLREFAKEVGRPFEVAVGALLVPALLVAMNRKLGYHPDSGCLFDEVKQRFGLVNSIRSLTVEDRCLRLMTPVQREAILAVLKSLATMRA